MILSYVENFPVNLLEPEFPRSPDFFKMRPEFIEMQKIIIDSIRKNGLKYPLCARNKNDDGKIYHVGMGMQRLAALKEMKAETCKVIVLCKDEDQFVPLGRFLTNQLEVEEIFGCKLKRFVVRPNCFEAQPQEDPNEWDPIRLKKEKNEQRYSKK